MSDSESRLAHLNASYFPVIIVGGGQAGLSVSYYLQQRGIDHLVLERKNVMHSWRTERWDSFTLVTPNWQCQLPDHPYDGDDPHGFMNREETNDYLDRFAEKVKAPVLEGVEVTRANPLPSGGFELLTSKGIYTCDQIVVASGAYQHPVIPAMAERLPSDVLQIHSAQYRNPGQLPPGAVLVVGSGQSGAQIAEDLHLAGRKVFLATGNAPRVARFYRGKDVVEWLDQMGYYDISLYEHPLREGVRDNTNHYVTGRDGGHEIDLRKFALEGMELYGRLVDFDGEALIFKGNLKSNLDHADQVYNNINARIDLYIERDGIDAPAASVYQPAWEPKQERLSLRLAGSGITSVVWCIGFTPDFHWIDAPIFDAKGYPEHHRGVTPQPGLYFVGLPWLHTWGSGRFSGIARDAEYLADQIDERRRSIRADTNEREAASTKA
jgi:putative flavoprotein involved in K+ transport